MWTSSHWHKGVIADTSLLIPGLLEPLVQLLERSSHFFFLNFYDKGGFEATTKEVRCLLTQPVRNQQSSSQYGFTVHYIHMCSCLMLIIVRGYEHSIFLILNLLCLVEECSALAQPVSEWSSTLEDSLDVAVAPRIWLLVKSVVLIDHTGSINFN